MTGRRDALRHSPALWGLYTGAAAFVGMSMCVLGWNAWEYRVELLQRLRDVARM